MDVLILCCVCAGGGDIYHVTDGVFKDDVFKGDLFFYTADGDLRDRVKQIDTTKCPLWLLTGEYDYSCTPQDTEFLGKNIPGARWQIMRGMGHFPMSEDPETFMTYLKPVLQDAAQSRALAAKARSLPT